MMATKSTDSPSKKRPKKPAPSAPPKPNVTHACLEIGSLAGDAQIIQGATFDPLYDRLFALGYPHFALLSDEEPSPDALLALAPDAIYQSKGLPPWGPWPRALARGVARVYLDLPKAFVDNKGTLSEQARATLLEARPIDLEEARGMFRRLLASWHASTAMKSVPRLLEALLGEPSTLALAEALLAQPDDNLRREDHGRHVLARGLALALLRVRTATRDELVRAVRDRLAQLEGGWNPSSVAEGLDLAVNGAAAIARARPRGLGYFDVAMFDVSREVALASFRARGDFWPDNQDIDARRPYLAGSEALLQECDWLRAFAKGSAHGFDRMAETYGHLRDPNTVALMLELAQKKASKKAAMAWLLDHADFARPVLEALAASSSERASLAAEQLRRLG
jgi:hypothetical protein